MFKNEFQGGQYFEVFSAQSKDAGAIWKQSGSGAKKDFDKEVRSFVYVLEGSAATTRIQIPKDPKHPLSLIQRFLILQLCVPKACDFSIDLGVSDLGNQKRRLVLSTTYKETQTNPLHSKVPLGFIRRAKWLNLCLDMLGLVGESWHGQTYKCVDSISVAGNCRLRRIFTMKHQPLDTTDDEELYGFSGTNSGVEGDRVPKQCQLASDIPQDVQVVTMTKVHHYEGRGRCGDSLSSKAGPQQPLTSRTGSQQDLDLSSSGGRKDNYHIAFGTKMSGSGQPRKGSGKEGGSTSRQPKYSHNRSKSDASVDSFSHTLTGDPEERDQAHFVKPHPPREPSSEKRRRPRVKSAGKERTPHYLSKEESSSACSSLNSSRGTSESRSNSGNKSTRPERAPISYQQPEIVANEDEVEQIMRDMHENVRREHHKSETESEASSHNTSDLQDPDSMDQDSLSEVIKALQGQQLRDGTQEYEDSEGDNADLEEEGSSQHARENLYTYASRPKRVPRGHKMIGTTKFERSDIKPERITTKPRTRRRSDQKSGHGHRDTEAPSGGETSSVTNSSEEDEDTEMTPRPSLGAPRKQRSPPRPKKDVSPQQMAARGKQRAGETRAQPGIQPRDQPGTQPITHPHPAFRDNGLVQLTPQMAKSPHSSQNRMSINRRSLREITNDERRKSGNQVPYNVDKYQPKEVAEVTDSFEQRMLASLQREMMDAGTSEDEDKKTSKLHKYDTESLSSSSDEAQSTLKGAPEPSAHNYQDEMKILSQEFLSQSNPRDWGNVFSPPIAPPTMQRAQTEADTDLIPIKSDLRVREGECDGDEVLDLLYDPVLNCYYDPVSCKYYELV